jgi:acyl-CoA thioesterase
VDITAPAVEGDVLTARCVEVEKGGRLGVYDVSVSKHDGQRIAMFRGRSYTARGKPAVPAALAAPTARAASASRDEEPND